ncbi:MAG: PHP domain-containing protein [Candidatus Woesearchaeota archaeon]
MLKIDLHVHTVQSGHAFNTIHDMALEARRKKMRIIGITDHGPFITGRGLEIYFKMGYRIPDRLFGVKILFGAELNIVDRGVVDLDDKILKKLKVVLAGFHKIEQYKDQGIKKNTDAMILAMKNPHVNIISHPYTRICPVDIEKVALAACKYNKLLELNCSNFRYIKHSSKMDKDTIPIVQKMIKTVKQQGKKFIINSDAHILHELGDDSAVMAMQKELGFTAKDVINNYPDELNEYVKIK